MTLKTGEDTLICLKEALDLSSDTILNEWMNEWDKVLVHSNFSTTHTTHWATYHDKLLHFYNKMYTECGITRQKLMIKNSLEIYIFSNCIILHTFL
jgi:hypothetical protein